MDNSGDDEEGEREGRKASRDASGESILASAPPAVVAAAATTAAAAAAAAATTAAAGSMDTDATTAERTAREECEAACATEVAAAEARLMGAWEAALVAFRAERAAAEKKCTLALYALDRKGADQRRSGFEGVRE